MSGQSCPRRCLAHSLLLPRPTLLGASRHFPPTRICNASEATRPCYHGACSARRRAGRGSSFRLEPPLSEVLTWPPPNSPGLRKWAAPRWERKPREAAALSAGARGPAHIRHLTPLIQSSRLPCSRPSAARGLASTDAPVWRPRLPRRTERFSALGYRHAAGWRLSRRRRGLRGDGR